MFPSSISLHGDLRKFAGISRTIEGFLKTFVLRKSVLMFRSVIISGDLSALWPRDPLDSRALASP